MNQTDGRKDEVSLLELQSELNRRWKIIIQFMVLVLIVLSLWSVRPHCSISNTGTAAGAEATFRLYFARTLTLLCFVRVSVVFLRSRSRRSDHRSRAWQLVCTMWAWTRGSGASVLCVSHRQHSDLGQVSSQSPANSNHCTLIRSALISIESLARRRDDVKQSK